MTLPAPAGPDDRALEGLRPWLTRYLAARIGSPDDAEDLVQEVLLALASGPARDGRELAAWAVGIARHKAADWWRAARRRPAVPTGEVPDHEDPAPGPAETSERRATVVYVRGLLALLPERDADLLLLRMSGCTAQETADALGMTSGSVRVAQHRALGRLREHLARGGGHDRSHH